MVADLEQKKKYLLEMSKIYRSLTYQIDNDCICRFLAFRIILNTMSYEDLIGERCFPRIRQMRDVFLAHKQEGDFFKGFFVAEGINAKVIDELILFMSKKTKKSRTIIPEVKGLMSSIGFLKICKSVLAQYEKDNHSGFRINNNFLCSGPDQGKEISSNVIASIAYRYHSSYESSDLANYFITNLHDKKEYKPFLYSFISDYILHAVNMYDSIFKDIHNSHSVDGLYEIMLRDGIGNVQALDNLRTASFLSDYTTLRAVRNKVIGHFDKMLTLSHIISLIESFDLNIAFKFVNMLNQALSVTTQTDISLKGNFIFNVKLSDSIISMSGIKNSPYRDKQK